MATNLNDPKNTDIENNTVKQDFDFSNEANITFGGKAEQMNMANPNYITQRNDYLVNQMSNKYKTFDEANSALNTFITGAKSRNTGVSEPDWTNTQTNLSNLLKTKYTTPATGITGITGQTSGTQLNQGLIDEQKQLKEQQTKAISDQYKSYNLAKSDYETNKNYYTNFDERNNKFNNVINSLQTIQSQYPDKPLTDDEYQRIATQYGVSIDEVKNPLKIYEGLVPTEEGKQKLGITKYEQGIEDKTTQFERQKADINTNLTNVETNINNQLADVEKQLKRNIDWMTAQGAWSGALSSSGYMQGIQNVRNDGQETINRLKAQLERIKSASAEDVGRLTADFNKGITRAKQDFDNQMKDITHNLGLQLNGLTEQYGLGNKTLSTALDGIMKEYGTKSADLVIKYANAFKAINDNTKQGMDLIQQANDMQEEIENKRYNDYIANNGVLITNTSLKTIADEVNSGNISLQRYNDLKTIMQSSIQGTLSKFGVLTQQDLNTIDSLLNQGKTPAEIVAIFQQDSRFQEKVQEDKGRYINVGGGKLYDTKTEKFISESDVTTPTTATTQTPGGFMDTDVVRALMTGKDEKGNKFFGVYMTDPNGAGNVVSLYNKASTQGLQSLVNSYSGTPITIEMINNTAQKYNVDPNLIAAVMANDSGMGTKGKGARTMNPGNVGNTDSGATRTFNSWQEGVDAVGANLSKRINAYVSATGKQLQAPPKQALDSDDAYAFVLSQLPTKSKDSDKDKAEIKAYVDKMASKGLSKYEIADLYQGFEIQPGDTFGENIRTFVGTTNSKEDMGEIGRLLNSGQKEQALRIVYNNAEKKAKDLYGEDYVTSSFVRAGISQVNDVLSFMKNNNLSDGIGVVDGTLEKYIGGKFRGKQAQEISTKIKNIVAEMRNKLSGSAVTASEEKFVDDLIPDIGDSPANFFIKLENLKNNPLLKYNNQMTEAFGFNKLDESTMMSFKDRVKLYDKQPSSINLQYTPQKPGPYKPTQTAQKQMSDSDIDSILNKYIR